MPTSSDQAPSPDTSLLDFYLSTYRPRRLPGCSSGTDKNYLITIRHLDRFLGRLSKLEDLTEDNLVGFLAWLVENRRQKPPTANINMKRLLALARYAYRKRRLAEEPEVQFMREPQRVPRAHRTEEVAQMLLAAAQMPGQIKGIPAGDWWPALIQVIYWTGTRRTATLSITRANVDLAEGTLLVLAETQKQHADQFFRLHPDCVAALERIWKPDRELMFPWPFAFATLYVRFRELLRMAKLPTGRQDMFQKIRRSTYSYSKLGGIDAGRQLGHHSDMSAHYDDPGITRERQACDVLPRPEPSGPMLRVFG